MTSMHGKSASVRSWSQTIILTAALLFSASLLSFNLYRYYRTNTKIGEFEIGAALEYIDRYHTQEIADEQKISGILNGLASVLGPHAAAYSPEELARRDEELYDMFVGVGVRLKIMDGYPVVVFPIHDTAAEKAGIQSRDVIIAADGKSLKDADWNEIFELLRGEINTKVELTVRREGEPEPITITIVRAPVPTTSIEYEQLLPDGETAYLHITDFTSMTASDLEKALMDLESKGMKKLVLDIRHNGGGLVSAAVAVADLFMDEGPVVTVKSGKKGKGETSVYNCSDKTPFKNLPLAVLVDEYSASASEIFAGAIKDHGRGLIVGDTTYGKGSVQRTFTEGLGGFALKFTTAKFYSPSGHEIQGVGISPDIEVEEDEMGYNLLMLAYETRFVQKFLPDYSPDLSHLEIGSLDDIVDHTLERARSALASREKPVPNGEAEANQQ